MKLIEKYLEAATTKQEIYNFQVTVRAVQQNLHIPNDEFITYNKTKKTYFEQMY